MPELLIEHQCPQCGAPAILKETDRLFFCEFCRVKSYLIQDRFSRYMLPDTAPKGKDLLFFPYWRFKGMLFSCVESGIKHRFIDVSYQAVESRYFPISLGLRSQALKLSFVTPEKNGYFLKPTYSFNDAMNIFKLRFSTSLQNPVFYQSHIGDTINLIYSPFYEEGKIYDAVLNTALTSLPPDDFHASSLPGGRPDCRIQFLATLCPACGWDMEGRRDTLILLCRNCNTTWRPAKSGFKPVKFMTIPAKGENTIYLPFWRIRTEIDGIKLDSYADLVRIANLPKAIRGNWKDKEFFFWSPAFKVSPRIFTQVGRNITLSQPQEEMDGALPKARIHPVTLAIEDAVESLTISLAGFVKPEEDMFPQLKDITIKPKRYLLVYMPFIEQTYEYVQPKLYLALNKNQLSFASNL
jgi:ribosomal protein L37AE/L43A